MTDSTNNSSTLNPVEQFDMYVAHVGINASNADEAEKIANLFTALMGLPTIEHHFEAPESLWICYGGKCC